MKTENTLSDNELVAEFMGLAHQLHLWECPLTGNYIPEEELQYHCKWSWIMPVVERIEDCSILSSIGMNVNIYNQVTTIKCKWGVLLYQQ